MNIIAPLELDRRLKLCGSLNLLDVRTPAEHAELHVPGVRLVPIDRLDPANLAAQTGFTPDQPLYIFCRSGGRAKRAAEHLEKAGYVQCHVVEGGTLAWGAAGLTVNRGAAKAISLERQVRITAGALVLAGVLLSKFVNPGFVWLSGLVGAGLIFAGISDWCGMGLLLAKMPWNKKETPSS